MDTATPISACLCFTMAFSVQDTLASGTLMSAMAMALMMKSLTETFQQVLAVLVLGRLQVEPFAQFQKMVEAHIHRHIEMRNGLLRFGQPPRDDLAHASHAARGRRSLRRRA